MTRSKLKTAIIGLIASAIMLALFLVPGIKSPASAETLTNAGTKTSFMRPDSVTVGYDKHTFSDGEKPAVYIHFYDLVIDGETWSPIIGGTFTTLSLKIEWAGAEDEYPRTDGKVQYMTFEATWDEACAMPGLRGDSNTDNNSKYLDLVLDGATHDYALYFAPDSDTFSIFAPTYANNSDCSLFYHPDITEDWYLTLTVTYDDGSWSYNGSNTAPTVTFSRITFNPHTQIAEFELSDEDKAYKNGYDAGYNAGLDAGYANGSQAGYNAGKTAGLAEGKKNGYDEGYDAGYNAAKDNTGTDTKTDEKPDNTITTDDTTTSDTTSWLKKNKTTLIVGSLLVVGVLVLLCILNGTSRRRR